jgi:hypothetical protein
MKSYKTTPAHFRIFKAEAQKWIREFGLTQYRAWFFHAD